jgi:hypothetical protein
LVVVEVAVVVIVEVVVMSMVAPLVEVITVQVGVAVARGCNEAGGCFTREGICCQRLVTRGVLGRR